VRKIFSPEKIKYLVARIGAALIGKETQGAKNKKLNKSPCISFCFHNFNITVLFNSKFQ
jgi:hypothetical protein